MAGGTVAFFHWLYESDINYCDWGTKNLATFNCSEITTPTICGPGPYDCSIGGCSFNCTMQTDFDSAFTKASSFNRTSATIEVAGGMAIGLLLGAGVGIYKVCRQTLFRSKTSNTFHKNNSTPNKSNSEESKDNSYQQLNAV